MKLRLILPLFLLATCFTAFGQAAQSVAADEKGLVKVSVMYPFAEGKTFNMEYYETKHMPMVAKFLGSNLVKYTIEKGVASGIPNQPLAAFYGHRYFLREKSERLSGGYRAESGRHSGGFCKLHQYQSHYLGE